MKNMKYVYDRKFTEVCDCLPKIIKKIDTGLTKLLQKLKWRSFFDSHGMYVVASSHS